jgi:hypothetical protein
MFLEKTNIWGVLFIKRNAQDAPKKTFLPGYTQNDQLPGSNGIKGVFPAWFFPHKPRPEPAITYIRSPDQ